RLTANGGWLTASGGWLTVSGGHRAGSLWSALEPVDLGLGGFDERVELRNLDGVLPLLAFAEAEEVGLIRRPPAVEEERVLADDGGAESGLFRVEDDWRCRLVPFERTGDDIVSENTIADFREVTAIVSRQ